MFGSYQEAIKILEGFKAIVERSLVLANRCKESQLAPVLHGQISVLFCAIAALNDAWNEEEKAFADAYYEQDKAVDGAEVEKAFQEGLCYGPYDAEHDDLGCWTDDLKDLDS